jgi:RimJ/RimL family protein N-acetyltransferase
MSIRRDGSERVAPGPARSRSDDKPDVRRLARQAVAMGVPEIRRVGSGDAVVLRQTRLAALADAPDVFGTLLDVAEARPQTFWERQCEGFLGDSPCATWLACDEAGEGVGMLAGVDGGSSVEVIQVWVAPAHRGSGLVDRLFAALVAWCPHQLVEIATAKHNVRALAAYERLGFVQVGHRSGTHGTELVLSQVRTR